jgi:hypothetical protein
METIFVSYDVLNSLQKGCMSFLGSFAKTCMIFGILMNKIILIETSYSKKKLIKFFAQKSFIKIEKKKHKDAKQIYLIFTIFLDFFEKNIKKWKIWKPYPASPVLYLFQGTVHLKATLSFH